MPIDELPQHRVYLNAYWISKTEITNGMYKKCVDAGVCKYSVSHITNPHFLDPAFTSIIQWFTSIGKARKRFAIG